LVALNSGLWRMDWEEGGRRKESIDDDEREKNEPEKRS
jgi:hypothetical protein